MIPAREKKKRSPLDRSLICCYNRRMNTTDLALALNANTIDQLEAALRNLGLRVQIDIDSDGQIMICTGLRIADDGNTINR
jgi:hypothetical protein